MNMKQFKNESEFTRWFCKCCEAMGAKTIAFVGSTMQQNGISDRYISHPLFRGWVEFKRNENKCTTLQRDFLKDMIRVGDVGLVVRLSDDNICFEDECGIVYFGCVINLRVFTNLCNKVCGELLLESLSDTWDLIKMNRDLIK